jgi:putative drug exporter of the RND superfamily
VWLLLLVAAGLGAATLSGKTVDTLRIPGQESTTALDILGQKFGSGANGATAQVVLEAPAGQTVTSGRPAAAVASTVVRLQRLNGVVSATDPLDPTAPAVSADMRAAYSTVTYGVQPPEITYTQRAALIGTVQAARDAGLTAEMTGPASVPPTEVGGAAELVGVAAAQVVLLLTYGSVVAAGMNLVTAIVGVAIGALGITTLTGFVDLQSTTPILALMLGLAVGIDYALFIFTRPGWRPGRSRRGRSARACRTGRRGHAIA